MARVFISYAREDIEIVRRLAEDLEVAQFDVWWDAELRGGDEFPAEIEEHICASSALLLVHSAASASSTWVERELAVALASGGDVGVVPIVLDRSALRPDIRMLHHIDFFGIQGQGPAAINSYQDALRTLVDDLRAQSPTHVLLGLAGSKDAEEREEAAFLLGQGRVDDDAALDRLMELLDDVDEVADVRFEAARALGKIGARKATSTLRKRLGDDDPDLVAAALVALGMLDADDCIEEIRERLDADDRFVRESAARALGALGAAGHVGALIHTMRNDPISVVRDAAAQALWMICEVRGGTGSSVRRAIKAIHRGGYTLGEVQEGCRRAAALLEQRAWPEHDIDLAALQAGSVTVGEAVEAAEAANEPGAADETIAGSGPI